MSSVSFSIAFGILLSASILKYLNAVPVPTTTLPPLPARRYLEPFDKDPFKDYQDYQDVSKRTLAQQALENAKKFPRPWGMPPLELFDNNFFNPNPYKEPDSRGILETNNIQSNFFEGYFPEDEFSGEEEEINFIEPPYPGDSNYLEPPQLTYVEQPLIGSYQPNMGYPGVYVNNDIKNDNEAEIETEKENSSEEDDNDYDNTVNLIPAIAPQAIFPPNMFPQKTPQQLFKQGINYDYDSNEIDTRAKPREFRSVKPTNKANYTPPPLETKAKYSKEVKPIPTEEPPAIVEKANAEKELFSRTTTITKTTTWYLNENNDIVVKEEVDGRPTPLKGKYIKTSKTTTSGPVPWYLQGFENVIFEEENEKSKTILDKITNLKGMTPTSITSFTTAPNPWSTEVHEEVVLEEVISKKESINEAKTGSHTSPLEHIVEYLPRTQAVSEEISSVVEELVELLEEEDTIIEINILPDIPSYFPPNMPSAKQYSQFPYQQNYPLAPPQAQMLEKDTFEDELYGQNGNFPENSYVTEMNNGLNQNQITTQKPPTASPLQAPEQQVYPQANFNYPQPTTQHPQIYGNTTPQPNREHPTTNPGNRRDKWDSQMNRQMSDENQTDQTRIQARIEQDRRDKMGQGKRQMYQNAQQQKGMNRQGRTPRDL